MQPKEELARLAGCDAAEFHMYVYKLVRCPQQIRHAWQQCPLRHSGENAARRNLFDCRYSSRMCPYAGAGNLRCPKGDACLLSHNVFESWLHPERYRTQLCPERDRCQRKHCWHAHTQGELRAPTEIPPTNPVSITPAAAATIVHLAVPAQAFGQAASSQRQRRQHLGPSHSTCARVGFTALSTLSASHAGGMLVQGQHAAASIPHHALHQQGFRWVAQQQRPAQAQGPAGAGQQQQQVQILVPAQPAHMQQGGTAVDAVQGVGHVLLQQAGPGHQQHSPAGIVQAVQQLPQQLPTGQVMQDAQGLQFQQLPQQVQYNQDWLQPMQQPQQVQYIPAQAVGAGQMVLQQCSPQARHWQGQQQPAAYVLQQTGQPALQQVSPQVQQPRLVLTPSVSDMQATMQQLPLSPAMQVLPQQQQVVAGRSAPGRGSSILHASHANVVAQGEVAGLGAGLGPGVLLVPAGIGMHAGMSSSAVEPARGVDAGQVVPASLGLYDLSQLPAGMQAVAGDRSCTPEGVMVAAASPGVMQAVGGPAVGFHAAGVQVPAQQQGYEQQHIALQQLMQRFGSIGPQ